MLSSLSELRVYSLPKSTGNVTEISRYLSVLAVFLDLALEFSYYFLFYQVTHLQSGVEGEGIGAPLNSCLFYLSLDKPLHFIFINNIAIFPVS